jgi:hypothetical protein
MSDTKNQDMDPNSTRGMYVIAKALAYALYAIDSLPPERQERSDRSDMASILLTTFAGLAPTVVHSAEFHTQTQIDVTDHKTGKTLPDEHRMRFPNQSTESGTA